MPPLLLVRAGHAQSVAIHIAEAGQQADCADGVGSIFCAVAEGRTGRSGRCVVDRRQAVALAGRDAAAVAVDHVVAQAHRAVVVGTRRDGEGAIAVIDDAAIAAGQSRHAQRVAIHIAEAGQQVDGADGVSGIFCAACEGGTWPIRSVRR